MSRAASRVGVRSNKSTLVEIVVGSVGPAANGALGSTTSNGIAQQFTPSTSIRATKVKINFFTAPAAGTYRVGIVSTLAAGSAPSGWLNGGTAYVDVVNPGAGDLTVSLPAPAAMVAGSSYFVVLYIAGGSVTSAGFNFTTAVPVGGTSNTATYGTDFSYSTPVLEFPFTLSGYGP